MGSGNVMQHSITGNGVMEEMSTKSFQPPTPTTQEISHNKHESLVDLDYDDVGVEERQSEEHTPLDIQLLL